MQKGVIIIHGLTGSPAMMAPLTEALGQAGFKVITPLLSGHGVTEEVLARTSWQEWYEDICRAYDELKYSLSPCARPPERSWRGRGEGEGEIYCAGLSLGSLLTLKLALDGKRPLKKIACLSLPLKLSPVLEKLMLPISHVPLIRRFLKYSKKDFEASVADRIGREIYRNVSYEKIPVHSVWELQKLQKEVMKELGRLDTPGVLVHSRNDKVALPFNVDLFCRTASKITPIVVWLDRSGHVETLDCEKDKVAKAVASFFNSQ